MLCYNYTFLGNKDPILWSDNRAFLYGDSLFETMILKNGQIRFFDDHWSRLITGMNVLGMQSDEKFSQNNIKELILLLAANNGLSGNARIKMQVWRKPGGLYTPENDQIDFIIWALPNQSPGFSIKKKANFYTDIKLSYSIVSPLKTSNALPYVMAAKFRTSQQLDEVVLLNQQDEIAELGVGNVFLLKGEQLFTPPLESGCIDGIMRKQIIRRRIHDGLEVIEKPITLQALKDADYVIGTNVTGLYLIEQIKDIKFRTDHNLILTFLQNDLKLG